MVADRRQADPRAHPRRVPLGQRARPRRRARLREGARSTSRAPRTSTTTRSRRPASSPRSRRAKASLDGAVHRLVRRRRSSRSTSSTSSSTTEGDFVVAVDSMPAQTRRASRAAPTGRSAASRTRARRSSANVTLKDMMTRPDRAGHHRRVDGHPQDRARTAEGRARDHSARSPRRSSRRSRCPTSSAASCKDGKNVRVVYTRGGWLDVDTLGDVVQGGAFQVIEAKSFVRDGQARRLLALHGRPVLVREAVHQLRHRRARPHVHRRDERRRRGRDRHGRRARRQARDRDDAELGARQRGQLPSPR